MKRMPEKSVNASHANRASPSIGWLCGAADTGSQCNVYGDPVNDALGDASSKIAERAISQLLTKSMG
jgi:hypothetical protein